MKSNWNNKKVAVLGLGIEGVSSSEYLTKKGANVTILDQKEEKDIDSELLAKAKKLPVALTLGEMYLQHLSDFDVIIRSPGVKRLTKELQVAEEKGVLITSQTKLFFDLCPSRIIGVTGTKGKGTTASLIYEMLKKQGFTAYLGGNIGKPPFAFLDNLRPQDWVVLELSSFQLQDLTKSPHIAVVLMITSEHLDYHKDIAEYVSAKRNILRFQSSSDFAILNRDYLASNESDIHTDAQVFQVSRERECEQGCFVKNGKIVVRMQQQIKSKRFWTSSSAALSSSTVLSSLSKDSLPKGQNDVILASEARPGSVSNFDIRASNFSNGNVGYKDTEIIKTSDILLPGKHNLENVCAAMMAVLSAGVSKQNIASVLKTFKGLEHRLELVAKVAGVSYYDDSFSTTPETAIAAIEAFDAPEILILGGSSKQSDFTELGRVISQAKNIKAIIGIGTEWPRIKRSIKYDVSGIKYIEGCKTMKEVVLKASDIADPGDVVILTPACASFDMFKNYKDRGDQFKREVKKLITHL